MKSKIFNISSAISIIFVAIYLTGGNLVALVNGYIEDDQSVFALAMDQFCIPKIRAPTDLKNKKLVVLRLDDVQAYSWRDISIQMIRDGYTFNAPVVAGVIPKNLKDDPVLMQFLKREHCNMEIAMHGWDHFGTGVNNAKNRYMTEFGDITYQDARSRIDRGKQVLEPLKEGPLTSFIPPFNIGSNDAIRAVFDAGLQVYSAIGSGVYDYHSTNYNFDKKRIVPVKELVSTCDEAFGKYGICVIMIHPQDYANPDKSIDVASYNEHYLSMLQALADMGVTFVTFENLINGGFHDL